MSMAWRRAGASLLSCPSAVGIPQPPIPRIHRRHDKVSSVRFLRRLLHGTRHKHAIGMQWSGCQWDPMSVVFLFAGGRGGICGTLARRIAMTGKRGGSARSSSSGVRNGAVAGVVLRDVGCPEELTSPVSFPVPAGISKSGALPLAAVARTISAKPLSGRSHDPW
jgi:hypothetical protein